MSRAYTIEEVRDDFLCTVRQMAKNWADLPDKTNRERCDGLAHSILVLVDGCAGMPGFTMTPSPHPDDKVLHEAEG